MSNQVFSEPILFSIFKSSSPYGSGKTVLLKKLYYRYSRYGETVLAFDAIDLLEILQEGEDEFIQFFEEISQDRNITFSRLTISIIFSKFMSVSL